MQEAIGTAAKSLQSCPTLCDPMDGSSPGSPRPWDSPGKNTGVGCHFFLQCVKVKSESEVSQSCPTLSDLMDCSPPGSCPWDFPGKSTGVRCHCLLRNHLEDLLNHRLLDPAPRVSDLVDLGQSVRICIGLTRAACFPCKI